MDAISSSNTGEENGNTGEENGKMDSLLFIAGG